MLEHSFHIAQILKQKPRNVQLKTNQTYMIGLGLDGLIYYWCLWISHVKDKSHIEQILKWKTVNL